MAIEAVTLTHATQAGQDETIGAYQNAYPDAGIVDMDDVGAILVQQANGVCITDKQRTEGSDGLSGYTPPVINIT